MHTIAPASIAIQIQEFIANCRDPVVVEPGEEALPLRPERFALDETSGGLLLQAWDDQRNLVRRIRAVIASKRGRMDLEVERFGHRRGSISIVDRSRPASVPVERRAARLALRERLRQVLRRQFTGWSIEALTTEADLEHSLSPNYPRALVRQGDRAWAAIAAPDEFVPADQILTFGLLWLDHARRLDRRWTVEGLCLLLPAGKELATCLRLRWMNRRAACFAVFLYDGLDWEELVDPAAHGNLATELLPPNASPIPPPPDLPEARIEAMIREDPDLLDPDLRAEPIYGQVAAWAGGERGILDLLACGHTGRLAVIELKASPEPHLPLQALDYWMRVGWHHSHGELTASGYFPGSALSPSAPRLLLAAPALAWHPSTETILRYFAPEVEVERIGLALDSPSERPFRVMFRLAGARTPDS